MPVTILKKYAYLLVHYCLELKKGERLYVTTSTLAEPLLKEVYREAVRVGAYVEYQMTFSEQQKIFIEEADDDQLNHVNPFLKEMMSTYDAYLVIRAPHNLRENQNNDPIKTAQHMQASQIINQIYSERIADRSLKRCLCQYPTQASAQEAGMSLEEYEHFVYDACKLYDENPAASWMQVRKSQQKIVDYLNTCDNIRYKNNHSDVNFSVKDRIWINSDGQSNMPSGEVFTGPIENTVEGHIYFDYPSIYLGTEVVGIRLEIKAGQVVSWSAEKGQEVLDQVFAIDGSRYFGEVAIGTNYNIQRITKNILFDEKIGGSIHMAVGQSYKATGGKNKSSVHWDMIADMKQGGEIWADAKLIYQNGQFII